MSIINWDKKSDNIKRINLKKKTILTLPVILVIVIISCGNKEKPVVNFLQKENNSSLKDSSKDSAAALTEKQRKIVNGARKNLEEGASYDLSMAYYVLKYKDGTETNNAVYPDGDIDPSTGVCTDVVIRSLRHADIIDLQKELHEDIQKNKSDYPMNRWGGKVDRNIDHRRVMNLEVYFAKYWQTIDKEEFIPGDIVVWDMNEDGASDHIGIVTDKKSDKNYLVIHNHPDPGYIAEEDKLHKWKISGHYRIKE